MSAFYRRFQALWVLAAATLMTACGGQEASDQPAAKPNGAVNVYSARHYDADLAIFDAFEKETGIKINLIEARGDALIERLAREGDASPADLFITADAGILWRAQTRGVLKAIDAPSLSARVPNQFKHPEGYWFGLTKRARVIIYNKELGLPDGIERYEDLADPRYKDMICIRSSSNIYNQSLLASLIAHSGEAAAEAWAKGVVANFARKPQGNDTAQIEAVAAGLCQVAVVNSYYMARFVGDEIGEQVGVFFPNQSDRGAHVNISGAGLAAHAPNPENATALLEYLLRDDVQRVFAQSNNEYPIIKGVPIEGPITSFGDFQGDDLPVSLLGENQKKAVEIFDRAGWL